MHTHDQTQPEQQTRTNCRPKGALHEVICPADAGDVFDRRLKIEQLRLFWLWKRLSPGPPVEWLNQVQSPQFLRETDKVEFARSARSCQNQQFFYQFFPFLR